jgi:hypothetical protein
MRQAPSFPRSAWEGTFGRSAASPVKIGGATKSVAHLRSHAGAWEREEARLSVELRMFFAFYSCDSCDSWFSLSF